MCYKGIIALKDAYCDPSSLQSGVEFCLVISKGVLVWEDVDKRRREDEIKRSFQRPFFLNNWKCDIYQNKYFLWRLTNYL